MNHGAGAPLRQRHVEGLDDQVRLEDALDHLEAAAWFARETLKELIWMARTLCHGRKHLAIE